MVDASRSRSSEPVYEVGFEPADFDPSLRDDGWEVPFLIWLADSLSMSLSSILSPRGLLSVGVGPTFFIISISELPAERMLEFIRVLFCSIYISVRLDWCDCCSALNLSFDFGVMRMSSDLRMISPSPSSSSSSSISEILENDFLGRLIEISFLGLSD